MTSFVVIPSTKLVASPAPEDATDEHAAHVAALQTIHYYLLIWWFKNCSSYNSILQINTFGYDELHQERGIFLEQNFLGNLQQKN